MVRIMNYCAAALSDSSAMTTSHLTDGRGSRAGEEQTRSLAPREFRKEEQEERNAPPLFELQTHHPSAAEI